MIETIEAKTARRVRFVSDSINTYRVNVRGRETRVIGWNMTPSFAAIKGFERLTGMDGQALFVWPITNAWQSKRSKAKRGRASRRRSARLDASGPRAFIVAWEMEGHCGVETVYARMVKVSAVSEDAPPELKQLAA